jgi:hypothetical protein
VLEGCWRPVPEWIPGLRQLWRAGRVRRLASRDVRGDGPVPEQVWVEAHRAAPEDGELLGSLNETCESCDGRGLRDTPNSSSWRVCEVCREFGSFFTKPAEAIEALRRRILAKYPDAASAVPDFFAGTPALSLANREMVDLSRERA